MVNNKLLSMLSALNSNKVFFGPQGFIIVDSEPALTQAQYGFGSDQDGNDLSGTNVGDWQPSWQVIARDTELGDPYFIDVSQAQLPVYTAFLGEAGWEVELVAASLEGFVKCINLLHSAGEQTQAQFFPDEKTIIDEAYLTQLISQLSDSAENPSFWQMFMRCYQDWLSED
ncbi:MAG: hypothetical protein ACPG52_06115 [Cognaticolwellia sp.]